MGRAARVADGEFWTMTPWRLGMAVDAENERLRTEAEIAHSAAWHAGAVNRAQRFPRFEEVMRPFRKASAPAGPVEDDDAVQREIERMVARADAQKKRKPKGAA